MRKWRDETGRQLEGIRQDSTENNILRSRIFVWSGLPSTIHHCCHRFSITVHALCYQPIRFHIQYCSCTVVQDSIYFSSTVVRVFNSCFMYCGTRFHLLLMYCGTRFQLLFMYCCGRFNLLLIYNGKSFQFLFMYCGTQVPFTSHVMYS
jgi:hypothetical protein